MYVYAEKQEWEPKSFNIFYANEPSVKHFEKSRNSR